MTPDEKIAEVKKIEQEFVKKVEALTAEYKAQVRSIIQEIDAKKIEALRKELQSQTL